jgi:hypothetical protein
MDLTFALADVNSELRLCSHNLRKMLDLLLKSYSCNSGYMSSKINETKQSVIKSVFIHVLEVLAESIQIVKVDFDAIGDGLNVVTDCIDV